MARAKERMQDRVGGSKIVVLASHSTGMLRDICNTGIVMEQGRLVHLGEIGSALEVYHRLMAELREQQESGLEQPGPIECKAYRSEERRVGNAWVGTSESEGAPD